MMTAPASPRAGAFPSMVLVDVTSRCNLSCIHCPSSTLYEEEGFVGDLDPALYRKIADEVGRHPDTIFRPFDGGEPLLRRDLPELIAYAKAAGIRNVAITTNGTLLTPRIRRALIDAGLDGLEVSLDANSAATYAQVRRSKLFDTVVANLEGYIDESRAAGPGRTVTVSFVAQQANAHERDAFVARWSGRADSVYVREYHEHNSLTSAALRLRPRATHPDRHPCPFVFERLIVHHDGRVKFCEFDWRGQHPVGDARTQTLDEIWNGAAMRDLRASHLAGSFDHPFCKSCTDWGEVRWPDR
jgi:radical SAM protein with 4Fe4S-binding SPASM domain